MRTHEVLQITGIPRERLYYLEQKGYINPAKTTVGEKDFREYSDDDVAKVRLIWRYLKDGFRYNVAYEKTMQEINGPELEFTETGGSRANK